jgi:subtilisin-like proprotein convertase family protein
VSALAVALLAGCGPADEAGDRPTADPDQSESPLSDAGALLAGAPGNDALPEDGKFDAVYPAQFDLAATQSPVRSQGSRGVCSIFATVALMEHLYLLGGKVPSPDFSEQFLQWSVKNEVGAFTDTEGSSGEDNLEAIHRFGIVAEPDHPYETLPWDATRDPECTGDTRPTRCYTNGDPPDGAKQARRWKLPPSRYVNSRERSIKAYLTENRAGVVAGMTFFYQSWNHRRSQLPVNSDSFSEGYVLSPNAEDRTRSLEKRAGHAILILGWDDDLEVTTVDKDGKPVTGPDGKPVVERGFFLFKNSWGTAGFGIRNRFGAGYGWLSMRYVEEHASVVGSKAPTVELAETCDDGRDNDDNGAADCADAACAAVPACAAERRFRNDTPIDVPDGARDGVDSTLEVGTPGVIEALRVDVDIAHPYRGDLAVTLISPTGTKVLLHDRKGGSEDDLVQTYTPAELHGESLAGTWTLRVADVARGDTGRLRSWSLAARIGDAAPSEVCGDGRDNDANGQTDCDDAACAAQAACQAATPSIVVSSDEHLAIPDGDPSRPAESLVEVTEAGTITSLAVVVDVTHPSRGDLVVKLYSDDGGVVTLHDREGGEADDLTTRFTTSAFDGRPAAGIWMLQVADHARLDTGTLNGWRLEIDVR